MQNKEAPLADNGEQTDLNSENPWQKMADEVLADDLKQRSGNVEDIASSEITKERAKLVAVENEDNIYHVEGILTAENIAEINSFKNKTTLILENTRGLSSDILSQIDSDRVFFSVKGGLDYEKIDKYNTDNYKERTMMSPKGLKRAIRYFERVESEIDPNWSETQKCMYAYNCLAVDMKYGEDTDKVLSKGTAARSLNGILYGELVCAGFAFTFQEMMNRAGIECHYQNQKDTHAYNVVKLDGKYYGVDVTFDNTCRVDGKCGFQNFGLDEHFYEKNGHLNYKEVEEGSDIWNDDWDSVPTEKVKKRIYDEAEQRFDLSTFTIEQLRENYSVISSRITNRRNGSYRDFAKQPLEVRERNLPVMDIREREITKEANTESAEFVNILRELQKGENLKLNQNMLNALQPRIGYVLDMRDGGYDSKSNFGEQELFELRRIRSDEVQGKTIDKNRWQTIIDSLNQQLSSAIGAYLSKTYENIADSINSYEEPTNNMDEIRMHEAVNRWTKMNLVINSKDCLIQMGYDQSQVDNICDQIESKLKTRESTPEDKKAAGIDFLGGVFSNKAQIREDIEKVEGVKLTDEDFEQRVHNADYLLNRIYTGLDLSEYGLTKDDFQELLDDEHES